jgi:hypothetical protein
MQPQPQPPPAEIVSPARESSHSSLTCNSPFLSMCTIQRCYNDESSINNCSGSSFISQGKRRAEDPPHDKDSKMLVDYGASSSSKRRYTEQHHLKKEELDDHKLWRYIKRSSSLFPAMIVLPPSGPSHRDLTQSSPIHHTTNFMDQSLPLTPQSVSRKMKHYQQVKTEPDDDISVTVVSHQQASSCVRGLTGLITSSDMPSLDNQTMLVHHRADVLLSRSADHTFTAACHRSTHAESLQIGHFELSYQTRDIHSEFLLRISKSAHRSFR